MRPTDTDRRQSLDAFRRLEREMTIERVRELIGPPDRYAGSGLVVLVYELADGTQVRVGSNGRTVMYVDHRTRGQPDTRLV